MPETIEQESIRRAMVALINSSPKSREELEELGQVWSTSELTKDFEVLGFMAPFVLVRHRSSHKKGTLMFQHLPRLYFAFEEENDN